MEFPVETKVIDLTPRRAARVMHPSGTTTGTAEAD
jgi:hypothetical protein